MSWKAGRGAEAPDAPEAKIAELTTAITVAQAAFGYLLTAVGRAGQRAWYSDMLWGRELYCGGLARRRPRLGGVQRRPVVRLPPRPVVAIRLGPDTTLLDRWRSKCR